MTITRFDQPVVWATSTHKGTFLTEMDTEHLMNILAMFIRHPLRTQQMMVYDLQEVANSPYSPQRHHSPPVEYPVPGWRNYVPNSQDHSFIYHAVYSVTSQDLEETRLFAMSSPLGEAIQEQLRSRGINTVAFIENVYQQEQLTIGEETANYLRERRAN